MPLRFGSFCLDEKRFELRRGETLVSVQPRVLETILFLAKSRHRLVTKEELIAGPWKGLIVSDTALSQAISQARAALGEDPKHPRFIETVRGKGFRFCGELQECEDSDDSNPDSGQVRPFFGRRRETDRLHVAANEARAGHGNLVLIHGAAGVGKTRLAQWFAAQQHAGGSEVCWGSCREGQSAAPYGPWPEVLCRYADAQPPGTLERLARGLQQELLAVAPELRQALSTPAPRGEDESQQRASSVIDAVASFLRRASAQGPLTLVLEDLHLADDAALHLLEVIARSIADTELMVLGTFRRTEGLSRAVLREASVGSLPHVYSIALEGLSPEELRQWLATATTAPLPQPVVDALHFSTEGLPFLVEAFVESLPERDGTTFTGSGERPELNERVKEVLGRRLVQLDPHTLKLLRTAAVCGEEFPIGIVAAASNEPLNVVLLLFEQAHHQGVLKAAGGGLMRFAHALHRDLLYHELEAPERRTQHALVARAFADQLPLRPETVVQAAHHFLEALPYTDFKEAVLYAQRAAEWAHARHAYGRAVEYYQRAFAVLDRGVTEPRQYAELLLALGHTQILGGAVDEARATLERTFELTRAHGFSDLFCRAILVWFQLHMESTAMEPGFHALIAEACGSVAEKDVTFAQLQVARAMAFALTCPASERTSWVLEALSLTQDGTNKRARLDVLRGALRCYARMPDGTSRLALAEEMLQLASQLRSPENELEARQWKAQFLLELGRGEEYAQQVSDYAQRATIVRTAQATWVATMHRVGQLLLAGNLLESERLAREAGDTGEKVVGATARVHRIAQLLQVGVEFTGADAERVLADAQLEAERILAIAPTYHVMLTVLLRAATHRGQPHRAREYLAAMRRPDYVPPDPLDGGSLCALVNIADVAAELKDVEAAAVVLELLESYDELHAVFATSAAYFGPASYWMARLHMTMGRHREAARCLDRALRASRDAGSVTYRAWCEYYLAQGQPKDALGTKQLLQSASRTAHSLGLQRLLASLQSYDDTKFARAQKPSGIAH